LTVLTDAAQTGRVGLALGGGAARGWAHIGVIRALKDAGIEPAVVAGTSVGAIVGSMVCSEHLEAFEDWVRAITRRDVVGYMDFALGNGGFIQGRRLMKRLQETIGEHRFADLQRPLGVVATDLYSGQERWLREGDLATAVNVMQDRITRSRMAGDPPALLINPRVEHIGLLEMHRGAEAIQAGYDSVKQMGAAIRDFNEG
jgi:NTE family protein